MKTASSQSWVQRYEDLRAHSVGAQPAVEASAWGLVLLVQRGVRGWMRAWQDPLRAVNDEPRPTPNPPSLTTSNETTLLLANMAMRSLALFP